ncbi:hypothetical protein M413DRAFT_10120 [Hebeloma cylindrosporum]|uniref:Uncharacterized protein n=1 Tax=Hebeloma cylindrosporum TaxID=76867 RepID=A0A0C3CED7_HEBCY|nr:hypothetical protein M413DRAFT_10120 [Hebeloma cylindrosporum h7]
MTRGQTRRRSTGIHQRHRIRNGRSTRSSSPGPGSVPGSSSPPRGRSRESSGCNLSNHDEVPSDEEPERDTSIENISDGYLSFKGRIFGRFRLMWEDLRPIVEEGMLIDAGKQLMRRRWVSEYKDLVALAPLVPDLVLDIGEGGLQRLDQARSKARASDVGTMKQNVHRWRQFTPPIDAVDARHLLGFHNMTTGRLLCPCDLNWDDLGYLLFRTITSSFDTSDCRIQKGLRDGTRKVQPQDFPLFLWKNEKVSSTDFFDGFMQGDMVLKSFLHIFIGPSAAHSSASGRSTRKGNAALHGIRTQAHIDPKFAFLKFRFVISDQSVLSQGGSTKGRWAYKEFYNALIGAMKDMEEDDLGDLLGWWQDIVFGGVEEEPEDQDPDVAADKKARKAAAATRDVARLTGTEITNMTGINILGSLRTNGRVRTGPTGTPSRQRIG